MSLNTLVLNNIALDLSDGSRVVERITGLDGAAPIRLDLEDRSQQNGAWDATPQYGSRVMQIEGFCEEADPASAQGLTDSLRALSLSLVDLEISSTARGTRRAQVRVQSGFEPEWVGDRAFTYTMTLVAPDPLLYGPESFAQTNLASVVSGTGLVYPLAYPLDYGVLPGVTPGGITAPNAGTASYHPRLRIDGPVTNPLVSMVETGDFIRFDGVVAAGQHLDINWGVPRRVTLGDNPVSMRHKVSYSGNWLAVPVGGGSITFSADDADPAATLSVWSYEGAWE